MELSLEALPRNSYKRPINSVKHIQEGTSILAATTDTVITEIADAVDNYTLADANGVPVGATIGSIFASVFAISEDGDLANEIPLIDWYIIRVNEAFGNTFSAIGLPTPGSTGTHANKSKILHTEKGISGISTASSSSHGVPMVFKGVIRIPKGQRRMAQGGRYLLCGRSNFATKVCFQFIYKHFS